MEVAAARVEALVQDGSGFTGRDQLVSGLTAPTGLCIFFLSQWESIKGFQAVEWRDDLPFL